MLSTDSQSGRKKLKTAFLHGVIVGVASVGWSLVLYFLGWDSSPFLRNLGFLTILMLAIGIYSGIQNRRDRQLGGFILYSDALWTGTVISFISSLLVAAFAYYYILKLNPGLTQLVINEKAEVFAKVGAGADKIERYSKWLRKEYSPMGQLILNGGGTFLFGIIFSAIFSIFLFEKKPGD